MRCDFCLPSRRCTAGILMHLCKNNSSVILWAKRSVRDRLQSSMSKKRKSLMGGGGGSDKVGQRFPFFRHWTLYMYTVAKCLSHCHTKWAHGHAHASYDINLCSYSLHNQLLKGCPVISKEGQGQPRSNPSFGMTISKAVKDILAWQIT